RIPVLTHEEARFRPEERESRVHPLPTIRKQTSGTTGEPLLFGYDASSDPWRVATKMRAYEWAGYQIGDRVIHFWGMPLASKARLRHRMKIAADRFAKRETYVSCTVVSDEVLAGAAKAIAHERPRALVCYAQAGGELARYILRKGLRTWDKIQVICG